MPRILLLDNYDSFTINLCHLLIKTLNSRPDIVSYNKLFGLSLDAYDMVVISPGPGLPKEYPAYSRLFASHTPVLGVCLGMQIMNEYFGGSTRQLDGCIHGRGEAIDFDGKSRFVARYHSLYCNPIAACFDIIGANRSNIPMAIRHKEKPIVGYQFHPESFMTPDGAYFINYAVDHFRQYRASAIS